VAINAESAPVTEDFSTGRPSGIYCDVISGAAAAGGSGPRPPGSAAALFDFLEDALHLV
jgi:hypothetical protein